MKRDCVMVIDDDADFRELMDLFLAGWGLQCVAAAECGDALPLLERERDRLRAVLLDYFMPGPKPAECLKAVLDRIAPDVSVILVSAAVDIAERASELGVTKFLAKPFETEQLKELLLGPAD
jgi:DNA-binding NtrC family response regulator